MIAAVFLLTSCWFQEVSRDELIGKWYLNLPDGGVELLELHANGTCTQDITLSNGVKYIAQGTWRYIGGHNMDLDNVMSSLDFAENPPFNMIINPQISEIKNGSPSVGRSIFSRVHIERYEPRNGDSRDLSRPTC